MRITVSRNRFPPCKAKARLRHIRPLHASLFSDTQSIGLPRKDSPRLKFLLHLSAHELSKPIICQSTSTCRFRNSYRQLEIVYFERSLVIPTEPDIVNGRIYSERCGTNTRSVQKVLHSPCFIPGVQHDLKSIDSVRIRNRRLSPLPLGIRADKRRYISVDCS